MENKWSGVFSCLAAFDYVVFALAIKHIHVLAATIVFHFCLALFKRFNKENLSGKGRNELPSDMTNEKYVFIFVVVSGVSGVLSVILSQDLMLPTFGAKFFDIKSWCDIIIWSILILSPLLVIISGKGEKELKSDMLKKDPQTTDEDSLTTDSSQEDKKHELFYYLVITLLMRLFGAFICLGLGYVFGESFGETINLTQFLLAAVCGIFVVRFPYILIRIADIWKADLRIADLRIADLRKADLRKADLRKADLRKAYLRKAGRQLPEDLGYKIWINLIQTVMPLLTFAWLLLLTLGLLWFLPPFIPSPFTPSAAPKFDYLFIGLMITVSTNILLMAEVSTRYSYKALVLSLSLSGAMIYLFPNLPLDDYLSAVEVSAILFILILSFRMDRLVRRTTEEERLTFSLYHRISALAEYSEEYSQSRKAAIDGLLRIDQRRDNDQLETAYNDTRKELQEIRKRDKDSPDTYQEITENLHKIEADVETLVHSKKQNMNFDELTALMLIGSVLVVVLLLFKPPELFGWGRVFMDISSSVLATVIVFLFFNLIDLQNVRNQPVLKKENGGYTLEFKKPTNRYLKRVLSSVHVILIIVAFVFLFADKWLCVTALSLNNC